MSNASGWCPDLGDWKTNGSDNWVSPHTLLPFFLVIYGVQWYYVVLLFYIWETSEALSMCEADSFLDESIVNMLVSDPISGFSGVLLALIILWKGNVINPKFLDYNINNSFFETTKEFAIDLLEIILIVSMSFIYSPGLLIPDYDADRSIQNGSAFYCLGLTLVYFLLSSRPRNNFCKMNQWKSDVFFKIQTWYIILFFVLNNVLIVVITDVNSMYLGLVITSSFIIVAFVFQLFYNPNKKIEDTQYEKINKSEPNL